MDKVYSRTSYKATSLLAAMIRLNRNRNRMTQQRLAERAGVSRATVQKIERGDMGISMRHYFEVAVISGVRLFKVEEDRNEMWPDRHFVEKLALLPGRARTATKVLDDDF